MCSWRCIASGIGIIFMFLFTEMINMHVLFFFDRMCKHCVVRDGMFMCVRTFGLCVPGWCQCPSETWYVHRIVGTVGFVCVREIWVLVSNVFCFFLDSRLIGVLVLFYFFLDDFDWPLVIVYGKYRSFILYCFGGSRIVWFCFSRPLVLTLS